MRLVELFYVNELDLHQIDKSIINFHSDRKIMKNVYTSFAEFPAEPQRFSARLQGGATSYTVPPPDGQHFAMVPYAEDLLVQKQFHLSSL